MSNIKCKLKIGMKGSSNGSNRCDYTEVLKFQSKKPRRREGKEIVKEQKEE